MSTRVVRIAPSSNASANGIIEYTMTCHSGGSLDIYIEPVLPKPQLVIFGRTELAQTLARLGKVMNYQITVAAPDADPALFPEADHLLHDLDLADVPLAQPTFAIVATQGEDDEAALAEALKHNLPYVAFVASRKKAERVLESLAENNVPVERLAQIKTPAGLDIGARLPEEIAVSILAEIIAVMRRAEATPTQPSEQAPLAVNHVIETLHLGEMSCSHCVLTVRKTLEAFPDVMVHQVEIGSTQISYNPAEVNRLTKQFESMQKMTRQMAGTGMGGKIKAMREMTRAGGALAGMKNMPGMSTRGSTKTTSVKSKFKQRKRRK